MDNIVITDHAIEFFADSRVLDADEFLTLILFSTLSSAVPDTTVTDRV